MTTTITVPDFQYAAMYYPEVYEILIQSMRTNVEEITDEDEAEPYIQMLRSVALGSHLNTCLLDLVAKESFLPTASLRSSVKRLLNLIDYELSQASPATVDLVIQLTGSVSATTQILAAGAQFSTAATADTPAITYEDLSGVSIARTDDLAGCYAYDSTGAAWTDHTTAANTSSSTFTPGWGAAPVAGDLLYFIHQQAQWNQLRVDTNTAGADLNGVWEYYDGHNNAVNPNSVTNQGSYLRIVVNSILGTADRTGAVVRVTCLTTGVSEDLTSSWNSPSNRVDTTAFLGQVSPSTDASDYSISVEWREPDGLTDNTQDFTVTGPRDVDFTLPQTRTTQWRSTEVNSLTGFAFRYRIVSVGASPTAPILDTADIDQGAMYVVTEVTQGVSRQDDPLGSSTGLASQEFTFSNFPVIDSGATYLKVYVDEGSGDIEWTRVTNFLSSTSSDRHYVIEFDDDGKGILVFGDGTTGKIPPAGSDNIRSEYRTMAEYDGNVGSNTITKNQSGSAFVADVWNPRPASGYQAREGSTAADLETAKDAGVASLRTGATAASPEEVETLTVAFTAEDGSTPFSRCLAIEEAYGVKTVAAVVVAAGGAAATTSKLTELEDYFNSDTANKEYGVLVINHQVVAENYTPNVINVTATVYGGNKTSVETALTVLLGPEAKDDDGEWTWDFGGEVPVSRIISEIMSTDPKPRKTTVTVPAADVTLAQKELPNVGTLSITIVP